MARAERMLRDEQIAHEVETYNQLIPDDGELSATLFIELTEPRAAGVAARSSSASSTTSRSWSPATWFPRSEDDVERLTRDDDITAAVHFLRFRVHRRAARDVRDRPGADRGRPSAYYGPGRAHRRAAQRAARRLRAAYVWRPDRADARSPRPHLACTSRSAGSIPTSRCPAQAHAGDAGYDLLRPRTRASRPAAGGRSCPTGLAVAIPAGYAGFVQPRSGLALRHGVTCSNTPGLIDPGYRDEISVLLVNLDPRDAFDDPPRRPHRAARDPAGGGRRVARGRRARRRPDARQRSASGATGR